MWSFAFFWEMPMWRFEFLSMPHAGVGVFMCKCPCRDFPLLVQISPLNFRNKCNLQLHINAPAGIWTRVATVLHEPTCIGSWTAALCADFIPFIKAKSLFERVAYLASIRQGLIVIIFLKRLGELTFKCLLFKVLFLLLSFYTQHKGCNRYIQVHYNPHICWPFNPWTHV